MENEAEDQKKRHAWLDENGFRGKSHESAAAKEALKKREVQLKEAEKKKGRWGGLFESKGEREERLRKEEIEEARNEKYMKRQRAVEAEMSKATKIGQARRSEGPRKTAFGSGPPMDGSSRASSPARSLSRS